MKVNLINIFRYLLDKMSKLSIVYNFLCNPESDTALGEEAMKHQDIFRLLNKEYNISDKFDIDDC